MTSFGQMRRYPKGKIRNFKKISTFSNSLFYNTLSRLYPLSAVRYTLFFVPNAQLRPIVERDTFLSLFSL